MQLKSIAIALAVFSAACASAPQVVQSGDPAPSKKAIQDIPDWIINPPKDTPDHSYSSGQGDSRDMSIAINAAEADARNKMSQQLSTDMKSLEDKFQSSVRGDGPAGEEALNTFRQAVRATTNQTLNGTRAASRKVTMDPSGTTYRVFVLMEGPSSKQVLMDKMKADANLYARFRASQAFQDLDAELKKAQDNKPPQTTPPENN
jgi:hypothetical protein